ncbi:MAG: isochorismatase family protein [Planctomycetes bacterium]|nr:isochorismatase family protein [Planctomycetota bacterium]
MTDLEIGFRASALDVDRAMVLLIDVQEKLLPLIRGHDRIVTACCKLLEGVRVFDLPVLATEQYPHGLGPTHAPLAQRLHAAGAAVLEKPTFSAYGHVPVRQALRELDRPQIIVVGIEAHVCVLQTALDLWTTDYDVFVCADAVGSRGQCDYEQALARLRQEGVYVGTVESMLFELCRQCDTPHFKRLIEVIKSYPPA